jgi:hypothetical protein
MNQEELRDIMKNLMAKLVQELQEQGSIMERFCIFGEKDRTIDDAHVVLAPFPNFAGHQLATAYAISLADDMGAIAMIRVRDLSSVVEIEAENHYEGREYRTIHISSMLKNEEYKEMSQEYRRNEMNEIHLIGGCLG